VEIYRLPNGSDGQVIEFTGKQIGSGFSHGGEDALRWTEVRLFRTQAGKYVLQKVGRSVVIHVAGEDCSSGKEWDGEATLNGYRPCPICRPIDDEPDQLMIEQDRHTVHVSDTAEGIVECAYSQDSEGVTYMTRVAHQCLLRACRMDPAIKRAFMTQKVD
jgi:hypothetical protein